METKKKKKKIANIYLFGLDDIFQKRRFAIIETFKIQNTDLHRKIVSIVTFQFLKEL